MIPANPTRNRHFYDQDIIHPDMDPAMPWLPDHALMVAVLVQAAHDLTLGGIDRGFRTHRSQHQGDFRSGRVLAREARWWFECGDVDWPFAFERICLELKLDPSAVRKQLLYGRNPLEGPQHRIGRTAGFRDKSRRSDYAGQR